MPKSFGKRERAKQNVRRAGRIVRWLDKAGVSDAKSRTTIAVDLSDALDAMTAIEQHLESLLRTNPATAVGRRHALADAASLGVLWSDELKYHVDRLHRNWERKVETVLTIL